MAKQWTAQQEDELHKLYGEGLSAEQIARKLGQFSKLAVITKATRLGIIHTQIHPKNARVRKSKAAKEEAIVAQLERNRNKSPDLSTKSDDTNGRGLGHFHLYGSRKEHSRKNSFQKCRWPIGDPLREDFRFCRAPVTQGSYCIEHAKIAYVQPDVKKRAR